jgi:hypothetical protein
MLPAIATAAAVNDPRRKKVRRLRPPRQPSAWGESSSRSGHMAYLRSNLSSLFTEPRREVDVDETENSEVSRSGIR